MTGRLYSWRADRRASRACIRHFIARAIEQKAWADGLPADWGSHVSDMSRQMAEGYRRDSVRTMARHSLEYARLRAFMAGAYGGPGDRPAAELWQTLHGPAAQPVWYYSSAAGCNVIGNTGSPFGPPLATDVEWNDWLQLRRLFEVRAAA